jgi:hypothetical protein
MKSNLISTVHNQGLAPGLCPTHKAHRKKPRRQAPTVSVNCIAMKTILTFLIILLLFGCVQQTDKVNENAIKTKPTKIKNLKFSLKNSTNIPIKEIKVWVYDTTLCFSKLNPMGRTEWVNVNASYRYSYLKFTDQRGQVYSINPIDFVGEKLYDHGFMTFIIQTIDTVNRRVKIDFSTQKE